MSDDANNLGQILVNTEKRFEIFIPKPQARINWGAGSRKKDENGPFGYPGISISAKDHVLVDAGGNLVQQSKGDLTVQADGDIGQFAGGAMRMTASKDLLLSGAFRVLTVAGAAPGPSGRSDHGSSLEAAPYSNLNLHYRIDGLAVGLFEFFHGRRERPASATRPGKIAKFNRKKTVDEIATDTKLKGGFAQNALRSLQAFYPTEKKGDLFFTKNEFLFPRSRSEAEETPTPPQSLIASWTPLDKLDPSDPVQLLDPLFGHDGLQPSKKKAPGPARVPFGGDNIAALKHGFGAYYGHFDPYYLHKVSALPLKKGWRAVAIMKNTLTRLRRVLDLARAVPSLPGGLSAAQIAPAIAVVDNAQAALGVVAARWDSLYTPSKEAAGGDSNALVELPFIEESVALAAPFMSEEKAKLNGKAEPFGFSEPDPPPATPTAWTLRVEAEGEKALETTITLGVIEAKPARLPFKAAPFLQAIDKTTGQVTATEAGSLVLEIDGAQHTIGLDVANAATPQLLASTLASALSGVATVTTTNHLGYWDGVLTTVSTGAGASIRVLDVTADADDRLTLEPGNEVQGSDRIPACANLKAVTAKEIFARLDPAIGAQVKEAGGALSVESLKKGYGSKIEVSGNLADKLFARKLDEVITPGPGFEDIDSAEALLTPIKHWIDWAKGVPSSLGAVIAPLTKPLEDVVAVMSKLSALVESAASLAGVLLEPPEAVGIMATNGITLGTQDRIVGTGGHGILFVVDGGTGEADREKFLPTEKIVSATLMMTPPLRVKRRQSLGFRVMSDSLVDLTGTTASQLFAMGRGLAKQARPDGNTATGVGIARVLGSYAAEVAGYEKVIISARSAGKSGDTDGLTGGRVEVMGQTIAIGGMVFKEKDPDGNEYGPVDFDVRTGADAHSKSLGLSAFELEQLAGAEHLDTDHKGKPVTGGDHLKMAKYCWPEKLSKEHPSTQHVRVHSSKDALVLVGPYMVHVDATEGVRIGMRKAGEDPLVNDVDLEKPRMTISKDSVSVVFGKDAETSTFTLDTAGLKLAGGAAEAAKQGLVTAIKDEVALKADKSSLTVAGASGIKLAASKIDASSTGTLKIKGGTIHIN